MKIHLVSPKQSLIKTDLTAFPVFMESDLNKILPNHQSEKISTLIKKDFKPEKGESRIFYSTESGRIILVGLGKQKEFNLEVWRYAVQQILQIALSIGVESISLHMPNVSKNQAESYLQMTAFAAVYGSYQFNWHKHVEDKDKKPELKELEIITKEKEVKLNRAIEQGIIIGEATNHARDLANHPGNIATPTHLAKHAKEIARKHKFICKVLNAQEIQKERLGLIFGVSAGSEEPAKFIILEYGDKKQKPVVLVGKGLTFDSGGISIKPADKMEEMKYDMSGGATVLGIFEAIASLKIPGYFVGLIPAVENLLSGKAVKPGDVLTSHDGKTVEIINTDAEGRLVLADAISYAKKHYQPSLILDFATLTGAVVGALGDYYTGVFSNTEKFNKILEKSSFESAEPIWFLPLAKMYKDQLKSQIADIKNVGDRGSAGASTAALFLESFVGEVPWIHFDIAGTAWNVKQKYYQPLGATAWGLYLTIQFLRRLK